MKLAITGHRPPRLGLDYSTAHRTFLEEFARSALFAFFEANCSPMAMACECCYDVQVYNGGAQGWDQAIMVATVKECPVVAAIPFKGHESKWPFEAREYYRNLLEACREVKYFGESYDRKLFAQRDHWMVNQADHVLALYDGNREGGTALTVEYAKLRGVPVTNVWEEFVAYKEKNLKGFCDNYKD